MMRVLGTLCVAVLAGQGAAANGGKGFLYPKEEGLKFYEKDTVNVSWVSEITDTSLWLFCRDGIDKDDVNPKKHIEDVGSCNGSWIIDINFTTTCNKCWFNVKDDENGFGYGFNSVAFSLVAEEGNHTRHGLDASETSTTDSTTTDPATETGPSSDSTTSRGNAGDGNHSELSTGAKVGIGAGVCLGVIGVAALAFAAWLLRRRRKKPQMTRRDSVIVKPELADSGVSCSSAGHRADEPHGYAQSQQEWATQYLRELDTERPVRELPTTRLSRS